MGKMYASTNKLSQAFCVTRLMHHLQSIGCHGIYYFNTIPVEIDFNTSVNICLVVFLFVYASIHYTLIIIIFPNTLLYGIFFTLYIVLVFNCGII